MPVGHARLDDELHVRQRHVRPGVQCRWRPGRRQLPEVTGRLRGQHRPLTDRPLVADDVVDHMRGRTEPGILHRILVCGHIMYSAGVNLCIYKDCAQGFTLFNSRHKTFCTRTSKDVLELDRKIRR